MPHNLKQKVLFKHCDPAGIVFYPRYFEMINDAVEDWFDKGLNAPFEDIHNSFAVPTVTISVDFKAPSRHGDLLDLDLSVTRLGSSSVAIEIRASCAGQLRLESKSTLVCIDPNMKPMPWPDDIREKISNFIVNET